MFDEMRLELMRGVSAQQKFKLQPDRMIITDARAAVVIVLQTNLGEFARIPRKVGRDPPARSPIQVTAKQRLILPDFTADPIASQRRHPALSETVGDLRIDAIVSQGFSR